MGFEDDIKRNTTPSIEDNTPHDLEMEEVPADLALGETAAETETKDAQRVREINRIFDEVSWYSKEGKLQLAVACQDFVRPYQAGGDASFPDLMQDQKLMPKTLEALRNIFLCIADFDSSANVAQSHPEIVSSLASIKNFLALEIAFELENIDIQGQAQNNAEVERTNQNNAFYVVSEALSIDDTEKKKAVEKWLMDHVDALLEMDPFKSSAEGVSTTVFQDALRNTSLHATDAVAGKFLKIAWDISEKESDGGTLESSETYSEVVKPILDRKSRPTMVAAEEIVLQAKQEYIASMITGKFGLDPSILEKWRVARMNIEKDAAGVVLSWEESYGVNLLAAEILELKSQGSAKRLFEEYGIANFARYDTNMLLRQLDMSDKDVPYGIVAFPEADWNGAFFQNADKLAEASLKLRMGGIETRIVEAGSQRELARRLVTLNKKYAPNGNKIAFAIIGGHGGENSVTLGEKGSWQSPPIPNPGEELSEEYLAELEKWKKTVLNADKGSFSSTDIMNGEGIRRGAQEFFVEGAPVVLVSCSTGAEGGIAEKSSGQLGWDISAPDIPTNLEKIDVTFDSNGRPLFDVKYNAVDGANTSRYVAGEKVESK